VNHDDCDRIAAMAPALALGALDGDEATFAREHLATCSKPHPELRDAVSLAAAIGASLPDEDLPSPALRERVLSAARAEGGPSIARLPAPPGRNPWRWATVGTAGLALAASLLLAVQVGESLTLRDQLATAESRLAAVATDLGQAHTWIERAVARGADAYFMDGEGQAEQASFMLVVETDASGAVLLMSGLPTLDADRIYELWVERDGQVVGVGTFRPDAAGLAAMTIDASLAGISQAMITIEPTGGSDAPSGDDVVMQGELTL
jgi:hypothetical protein